MRLFKLIYDALRGIERDYTTEPLNTSIFLLAVPMVIEMAMESAFAIVDAYFVSKIGTEAITAVGLTESVLILVYAVAFGLSMGTTAMVARRVGEKDKIGAAKSASQAIYLGIMLSSIIGLFGFFYAKDILILMEAEASVVAIGYEYTEIIFAGNISIMLIFLINAIFRGAGNAAIAMKALILSNGINILLDPCLIFGYWIFPELGVKGAAVATTIGRSIGVIYQITALLGKSSILVFNKESLKFRISLLLKLIKISLGGIGQFVISTFSWSILVRIIAQFGSEVVAGYTIAIRIIIFTILPSWGLANAAATLVGQNLGAKKPERAESAVWKCSIYNVYFLALIMLIFNIFAEELISVFSSDQSVIESGINGLRIISSSYLFFAYSMVLIQAFNGAGDTATPTWLNFIFHWLVQIPLAFLLAENLGMNANGVYAAIPIAETLLTLAAIIAFRRGSWKTKSV
jgi:putative MATE family efflux protein